MTASAWAGLVVASLSIIASIVASIRFLVKHYLSELKPDNNGGHNLEGRVSRIEAQLDIIIKELMRG